MDKKHTTNNKFSMAIHIHNTLIINTEHQGFYYI